MAAPTPTPPGPPLMAPPAMVLAYAGFWWRVLACLLDQCVLAVAVGLIGALTGLRQVGFGGDADQGVQQASAVSDVTVQLGAPGLGGHWHGGGLSLVSLLLPVLYYALLESSRWQATLGKRCCRIRVTDEAGRRIGLGRVLGRELAKFVSLLIFGIGYLMVGWTRRKQGLHDLMAGTLVMRLRPADTVFGFQPPA